MTAAGESSADPRLDALVDALVRLLALKRIDRSRQELVEQLAGDLSAQSIAAVLRAQGVSARVVRIDPDQLHELDQPIVLLRKTGELAAVTAAGRRGLVVEMPGQPAVRVTRVQLVEAFQDEGLDLSDEHAARGSLLVRAARVLASRPSTLGYLGVLAVAAYGLRLGIPMITQAAIDDALPNGARSLLVLLAAGVLLMAVHRAWLEVIRRAVVRCVDARLQSGILRGIFAHIMTLPLPYLQSRSVGDQLQYLDSARNVIERSTSDVSVALVDGVLGISCLVLIGLSMPGLALSIGAIGALLVVMTVFGGYRYAAAQARVRQASAHQRGRLYELIEGMLALKTAGAEQRAVVKWLGTLADYQTQNVRGLRLALGLELLFEAMNQVASVGVLLWGVAQCARGSVSVGTLISSVMLAQAFMSSLLRMGWVTMPMWGAYADLRRVNAVLAMAPARSVIPTTEAGSREIVLEDVWFRYSDADPWILRGYSLRVPAGALHEITGPSGVGKTTVLRLIAGLYAPQRGRVTIGGHEAADVASETIAYVPQHSHLFEGSILENLALLSQAPLPAIFEAAKVTGLDEIVNAMPMKYETRLPPGGRSLSGGQRQLVALTGCIASRRSIVLLDEAFSHLDRLTRERLRKSQALRGKTVIAVEHETTNLGTVA